MSEPEITSDFIAIPAQDVGQTARWYREMFRKSVGLNLILTIALLVSVFINYQAATTPPDTKYFATTTDGRLIPLTPLSQPNQKDSSVLQWSTEAVTAAFTWNFQDYKQRIADACRDYFTKTGCKEYQRNLDEKGILTRAVTEKLLVSAVITDTPIIKESGLGDDGLFYWLVELPFLVTYEDASKRTSQGQIMEIRIKRKSVLESEKGLGIEQVISRAL